MGRLRIINGSGDTPYAVDEDPAVTGGTRIGEAEARKLVANHVGLGGLAYAKQKGGMAEQVREYDPRAEEVVLAPRMQGG